MKDELTPDQQKVWERLKYGIGLDFSAIAGGINWTDAGETAPPNPATGTVFFNTATNKVYCYNGMNWILMSA